VYVTTNTLNGTTQNVITITRLMDTMMSQLLPLPSLITSFLKHKLSTSLCLLILVIPNARTTRIYLTKYIYI